MDFHQHETPQSSRENSEGDTQVLETLGCNVRFVSLIDREIDIAMEGPTGCRYWKSL